MRIESINRKPVPRFSASPFVKLNLSRNRGYARRNYLVPSTGNNRWFEAGHNNDNNNRLPLCCAHFLLRGRRWTLEGVSNECHASITEGGVERLGDDYREHGGNNRWGCWREGFDLCDGFFFFSILSGMVNSPGEGLAAAFRDGFRKGLRLNFFAVVVDWKGEWIRWICWVIF